MSAFIHPNKRALSPQPVLRQVRSRTRSLSVSAPICIDLDVCDCGPHLVQPTLPSSINVLLVAESDVSGLDLAGDCVVRRCQSCGRLGPRSTPPPPPTCEELEVCDCHPGFWLPTLSLASGILLVREGEFSPASVSTPDMNRRCQSCGRTCPAPTQAPLASVHVPAAALDCTHADARCASRASSVGMNVDDDSTVGDDMSLAERLRGGQRSVSPEAQLPPPPTPAELPPPTPPVFVRWGGVLGLQGITHDGVVAVSTDEINLQWALQLVAPARVAREWASRRPGRFEIVDVPDVSVLLNWTFMQRAQIKDIAAAHNVRTMVRDTRDSLVSRMRSHCCDDLCSGTVYVFHMLSQERRTSARQHAQARAAPAGEAAPLFSPVREPTGAGAMQNMMHEFQTAPAGVSLEESIVIDDFHLPYAPYPEVPMPGLKREIVRDFQQAMDPALFQWHCCAVCGQRKFKHELVVVNADEIDLHILRNDNIPSHLWPIAYNFKAYERAFLDPRGMQRTDVVAPFSACLSCASDLDGGKQPPDSIANFHYYAYDLLPPDVRLAFEEATPVERTVVAACRTTQLSFTYTREKSKTELAGPFQHYMKGNVAVIPQDVGQLSKVLPPSPDDSGYSVCVLFVGHDRQPDMNTLRRIQPLLVRKERVETMLRFLVENNTWYREANMAFSPENLSRLCSGPGFSPGSNTGVPATVEIQHLPHSDSVAQTVNCGPADHNDVDVLIPNGEYPLQVSGFTGSEQGSVAETSMKARALQWCLDHKPFLAIKSGNRLFPERDPRMLTFAFPHLDPWGLGGFNNPLRQGRQQITMQRQVKNLVNAFDGAFKKDPQFAYVCFNAIQKLESYRSVQFRVKPADLSALTTELMENRALLEDMSSRWAEDETAKPSTRGEKRMAALIRRLEVYMRDIHGSNGRKVVLRNEIRALLKNVGCPALFLTLNPADLHSKLFHVLAGKDINEFAQTSGFERLRNVADNPDAAAIFFNLVIESFLKHVLRFGTGQSGLFGLCTAYYGTVEAQGRGSLHCHMLIWLRGHLNPQKLRDELARDPEFQAAMFGWLESIIHCEPPGAGPPPEDGISVNLTKPDRDVDVRTSDHPWLEDGDDDLLTWEQNYTEFVKEMVFASNWHDHKATCWKYLKSNEPHDDAHCRMRMDGTVRASTCLDTESGAILLRRWHPKINNYNDLVTFLYKCNMDIKFIGSGQAAKALVYYVTDYITKSALPLHLALQALCWAVKQNDAKFEGQEIEPDVFRKSLLVKSVNSMMARQELSHQQVMSWIVGGGDRYCSHSFKPLCFGEFDKWFASFERTDEATFERADDLLDIHPLDAADLPLGDADLQASSAENSAMSLEHEAAANIILAQDMDDAVQDDLDEVEDEDDERGDAVQDVLAAENAPKLNLQIKRSGITQPATMLQNYRFRGSSPVFDQLSLWDYVAVVEEMALTASAAKTKASSRSGERIRYQKDHPRHKTHICRLRTRVRLLPNFIGVRLPRLNRSTGEDERYYRAMLILFKPWRNAVDLRGGADSWKAAFMAYTFPAHLQHVIGNIHIEDECRDAREEHDRARRRGEVGLLIQTEDGSWARRDDSDGALELELYRDDSIDARYLGGDGGDSTTLPTLSDAQLRKLYRIKSTLKTLAECGIVDVANVATCAPPPAGAATDVKQYPASTVETQRALMTVFRKNKRPRAERVGRTTASGRIPLLDGQTVAPAVAVTTIADNTFEWRPRSGSPEDILTARHAADEMIRGVLQDLGAWGNVEQSVAVGLVGEHLTRCSTDQLMMYVAGEGGTGKSHVIKCIVELFRRAGVRARLLLGAPTGIASVLIGGYTVHALTFLPKSTWPCNVEALHEIWKDVDYLIVDEVSMISAVFLAHVCERIRLGRGTLGSQSRPYAGVNLIFMGDFGQLRPVGQRSLFSDELIRRINNTIGESVEGQTAIFGASLWRQVTSVVTLRKNWRQHEDPRYAELVARVRVGQGTTRRSSPQKMSDYELLSNRQLNILRGNSHDPAVAQQLLDMRDAPIVVADKQLRDSINEAIVHRKARQAGVPVHNYMAIDRRGRKDVTGSIREALWGVRSSVTKDALGAIPIFVGMRVMFTENIDIGHHSVNGAEGTITHVKFSHTIDGHRVATVAYVSVPGSGIDLTSHGVPYEVVPVFPTRTYWKYTGACGTEFNISRLQLPLLPAYAYTDYKSQGRSLPVVLADVAACRSSQSLYVMLSRVRSLGGLGILRPFPPEKITQGLSHDLRRELERVERLSRSTVSDFVLRNPSLVSDH